MNQINRRRDWRDLPVVLQTDPIFFHKSQLAVGTRLRCFGRRDPNTTWVVEEVWTIKRNRHGGGEVRVRVTVPQTLRDRLVLRREYGSTSHELSFGSASYSAIWRIEG